MCWKMTVAGPEGDKQDRTCTGKRWEEGQDA